MLYLVKLTRYLVAAALCALILGAFQQRALAQIAPGVTQSAARTATITGTVTQNNGTPVAGADVELLGPAVLSTKSNDRGVFSFIGVPWGVYKIEITSSLGVASRNNVIVNGDTTVAVQYRAQVGLHTIAHVSTSSAGASINVTPASIASINPSEYAFQGNTSWKALLDQIPGVAASGFLRWGDNLSVSFPGSPLDGAPLSINGALAYETATMLDGMPLIGTSISVGSAGGGYDVSSLALPTFDTADIVRGPGADAPSIVDSIGGSFVLHSPDQVERDQSEFSVSNDPYGGIIANAKVALRLGRLSATIVYGINNSPGPLPLQRTITAISETPTTVNGSPWYSGGMVGYAGCSGRYSNCFGPALDTMLIDGVAVSSAWSQHNGSMGLSYQVTPSVTAQVFYSGSSRVMVGCSPYYPAQFTPGPAYSGSIAPGLHNYPFEGNDLAPIAESSNLLEERVTAYLGPGVLRLAAMQNNAFWQQQLHLDPNGRYTLYGTGYYCSDPTCSAQGAAAVFNGASAYLTFFPYSFNEDGWSNNRDLLGSYATQVGPKSNVGISYVTSYYNSPSFYECILGAPYNFTLSGSQPPSVSETTNEVRLHAGAEVSENFSLDASWYFANGAYHIQNPANPTSSYANSTFPYNAPRLGVVWRENQDVVIRAAAGGGYALPPLNYLTGSNGTPFCNGVFCSVTLNNLNLTPERSFGVDVGTDIRLHQDTAISLDLYRTNLYGQFFQSTSLTGTLNGFPLYTTQYNNLTQSRMEGVNFDIRHDVPKGLYWHGAFGLTRGYVVSVSPGFYNTAGGTCNRSTGANCANTYIIPGINFDGQYQAVVPYANASAQLGYRWAPGRYIDVSPTYFGNNNQYFEPAFVEIDVHGGYALTRNVSLLATFRNINGAHDQSIQTLGAPVIGLPNIAGPPFITYPVPYGPRSVIVTLNYSQE